MASTLVGVLPAVNELQGGKSLVWSEKQNHKTWKNGRKSKTEHTGRKKKDAREIPRAKARIKMIQSLWVYGFIFTQKSMFLINKSIGASSDRFK